MPTKILSSMTVCSHSHLLHPFCPRQNSTEKVANFVLYALGAAVAFWALYQMNRPSSPPPPLGSAPLSASRPLSGALELARKFSSRSASAAISAEKGGKAPPTPNEIADHFSYIVETARKQPGKPIAYDWTQKNLPISDDTPRFTVLFMQLEIEAGIAKEEVALIANSALPGQYIRWTSLAESDIRKGNYPERMEQKILLQVLNARPIVFTD
ncbi:MAG: hypothetical protein JSS10_09405 [Verrucomicrobia bacterium]|nr:hypothetical protein [Verrucomicrobiota bacterium]